MTKESSCVPGRTKAVVCLDERNSCMPGRTKTLYAPIEGEVLDGRAPEHERNPAGEGTWRAEGREACCGPGDVETRGRCLPQELWSSGGALQVCKRGGVCLKSSGGTL